MAQNTYSVGGVSYHVRANAMAFGSQHLLSGDNSYYWKSYLESGFVLQVLFPFGPMGGKKVCLCKPFYVLVLDLANRFLFFSCLLPWGLLVQR